MNKILLKIRKNIIIIVGILYILVFIVALVYTPFQNIVLKFMSHTESGAIIANFVETNDFGFIILGLILMTPIFLVEIVSSFYDYNKQKKLKEVQVNKQKEIEKLYSIIENREQSIDKYRETAIILNAILNEIAYGLHNFGDPIMYFNNQKCTKKHIENLRLFSTLVRGFTEDVTNKFDCKFYTIDEYKKILTFIKKDFHDYFHNIQDELDLEKLANLVYKSSESIKGKK